MKMAGVWSGCRLFPVRRCRGPGGGRRAGRSSSSAASATTGSEGVAWDGVRSARADHEASLFGLANVVGVAVGRKIVRGGETDEPCIVVYVARKLPASALRPGGGGPR